MLEHGKNIKQNNKKLEVCWLLSTVAKMHLAGFFFRDDRIVIIY